MKYEEGKESIFVHLHVMEILQRWSSVSDDRRKYVLQQVYSSTTVRNKHFLGGGPETWPVRGDGFLKQTTPNFSTIYYSRQKKMELTYLVDDHVVFFFV